MTLAMSAAVEAQVQEWQRTHPDTFNSEDELRSLRSILANPEVAEALAGHEIDKFIAAGGSGLILRVVYRPHNIYRVLKIPRSRFLTGSESTPEAEDPEVRALGRIMHENIPRLFASVPIGSGRKLLLSEYIDNEMELHTYVASLCAKASDDPTSEEARKVLTTISRLLLQLSHALAYMHETGKMYHFDVKPANILVSHSRDSPPKAWLIDLGLAKEASLAAESEDIKVGFTLVYAHPILHREQGLKITNQQEKSTRSIPAKDLDYRYDLFAFGKTIQECLKIVRSYFGQHAHRLYEFEYLHMLACLMLDGHIIWTEPVNDRDPNRLFVEDIANGCGKALFVKHKFTSISDVVHALHRLLGMYSLEQSIPELNPWFPSPINVSDIAFANLTDRVRDILLHPMFKRLERERQLGLLSEVFPTATHTRGNHSLGVYAAACQYITALYHDPENPACKILFSENAIKLTLIASLLHDLGQTAFGHDIEEVHEDLFSHSGFTNQLLTLAEAPQQSSTMAFSALLAASEPLGWGLGPSSLQSLKAFIQEDSYKQPLPILGLLRQIIDGPIDADKLDYIIRDSVDCRVQYGHGIDVARFLRSLTAHWVDTADSTSETMGPLRIGIKAKGKASADAFIIARAQLYQSVYWHHTFRTIKAMFLTAAARAIAHQSEVVLQNPQRPLPQAQKSEQQELLPRQKAPSAKHRSSFNNALRDAYFFHVYARPLGLSFTSEYIHADGSGLLGQLVPNVIDALRGITADQTLDFFYQIGDEATRELLGNLVARRFYKRLWEKPISEIPKPIQEKLAKKLRDPVSRIEICEQIEGRLHDRLIQAIGAQQSSIHVFSEKSSNARLSVAWRTGSNVIVDMPLRAVDNVIASPDFVPDYRRKYIHSGRRPNDRSTSTTWRDDVGTMLKESAYFRVFVRPEVHPIVLQHLDQVSLDEVISDTMR